MSPHACKSVGDDAEANEPAALQRHQLVIPDLEPIRCIRYRSSPPTVTRVIEAAEEDQTSLVQRHAVAGS